MRIWMHPFTSGTLLEGFRIAELSFPALRVVYLFPLLAILSLSRSRLLESRTAHISPRTPPPPAASGRGGGCARRTPATSLPRDVEDDATKTFRRRGDHFPRHRSSCGVEGGAAKEEEGMEKGKHGEEEETVVTKRLPSFGRSAGEVHGEEFRSRELIFKPGSEAIFFEKCHNGWDKGGNQPSHFRMQALVSTGDTPRCYALIALMTLPPESDFDGAPANQPHVAAFFKTHSAIGRFWLPDGLLCGVDVVFSVTSGHVILTSLMCKHRPREVPSELGVLKQANTASLFTAPEDDERSKAWERLIPRADKSLEKNCVVCEAHLDERFIVRTYKHVINGETVQIRRDRPCLTPDAIRTVFPNVPLYLTKKLPPKRKTAASNAEWRGTLTVQSSTQCIAILLGLASSAFAGFLHGGGAAILQPAEPTGVAVGTAYPANLAYRPAPAATYVQQAAPVAVARPAVSVAAAPAAAVTYQQPAHVAFRSLLGGAAPAATFFSHAPAVTQVRPAFVQQAPVRVSVAQPVSYAAQAPFPAVGQTLIGPAPGGGVHVKHIVPAAAAQLPLRQFVAAAPAPAVVQQAPVHVKHIVSAPAPTFVQQAPRQHLFNKLQSSDR
ncbi:hypothetical protein HPB52_009326 [Rhipicephalus sanguineus]|uniref:THAP-type domain-containing protein n=1 Tax=Rhipicephalus sanguineus TaxID=34632 RepID=A0A9D4PJ82_RHISA|nr:hypothetical protein HPB52_009326 [Rhipicephalus sanguineus]